MPLPKKPRILTEEPEKKKPAVKKYSYETDALENNITTQIRPLKEPIPTTKIIENLSVDMLKERENRLLSLYYEKLQQFDNFLTATVITDENAIQILKIMKEIPILFQTGADCKKIIETKQAKEVKARGDKSLSLLEQGLLD